MASEKIRLARRYYRRLGPYRLVFTGSIVCMAMVGLLEPLLPLMLKPLLDGEAGGGAVFTHLPWLMIGVVAARCAFAFGRGYSTAWVESQMLRDLRGDMAAILPRLPAARYAAESGGDFIARMMPFASHTASSLTLVVVALVQDSIKTLFYAASLFFLQWQLALIVFSVSPIVIFAVRKLNRRIKKISQVDQALLARGQNIINETAASWRLIKAGGGEEAARARLAGLFARMRGTMLRIRTAVSAGQPLTQFILAAAFSLVLFYIVNALKTGEMSAGDAGAFLAVMLAMQAPARSIVGALAAWEQGTVAAREVFNFLDSAVEDESGADIERARGETVFAKVGFSYPGAETPALSGLSFSLAAGEHVALVGESGAGKDLGGQFAVALLRSAGRGDFFGRRRHPQNLAPLFAATDRLCDARGAAIRRHNRGECGLRRGRRGGSGKNPSGVASGGGDGFCRRFAAARRDDGGRRRRFAVGRATAADIDCARVLPRLSAGDFGRGVGGAGRANRSENQRGDVAFVAGADGDYRGASFFDDRFCRPCDCDGKRPRRGGGRAVGFAGNLAAFPSSLRSAKIAAGRGLKPQTECQHIPSRLIFPRHNNPTLCGAHRQR